MPEIRRVHRHIAAAPLEDDPATLIAAVCSELGAVFPGYAFAWREAGETGPAAGVAMAVPVGVGETEFGTLIGRRDAADAPAPTDEALGALAGHLGRALANMEAHRRLRNTLMGVISSFSTLVEGKDDYTEGHCERIAEMALALGIRFGLSGGRLDDLTYAGLLHDVGKVAIPDAILNKPGPLTPEEYAIMQTHPTVGRRALENIDLLQQTARIVEQHHEHYDGNGYPHGLRGEEILLEARIVATVDAYDAMTTRRPYRAALPRDEALARLNRGAGTQFDPEVVEAFVRYVCVFA